MGRWQDGAGQGPDISNMAFHVSQALFHTEISEMIRSMKEWDEDDQDDDVADDDGGDADAAAADDDHDDDDVDGVIYVNDFYVLPKQTCWKLIWIVIIRIYSDSILTYKTETSFNIILMLLPYQTLNIIYIPSSVQFQSVPAAVAATLVWDF